MNVYRPDYDLHKLLLLPPDCTQEEAKAAAKRALRVTHPDQGGSREIFQIVQWAHGIIENPVYWQLYNRERQAYWRPLLRRALKRPEAPDIWPRGTEPQQEGGYVAAPLPMRIPRVPRAPEGGAGPSSAVPAVADVSPEAEQRVRNMPHGWWHLLKRRLALRFGWTQEAEPEWLARLQGWSQEFTRTQEAAARRKVAARAAKRWIKQLTREGTAYMDRSGGQVRKTFTRNTPNGGTAQTTVTIMAGLKWRTQEPQGDVLFETWLVPDTPREDEAQYRGDSHNIHRLWRQLINDAGMLKSLVPPPALPEGMMFELAVNADFLVVRVRGAAAAAPEPEPEPEEPAYHIGPLVPGGCPMSVLPMPSGAKATARKMPAGQIQAVIRAVTALGFENVRGVKGVVGPTVAIAEIAPGKAADAPKILGRGADLAGYLGYGGTPLRLTYAPGTQGHLNVEMPAPKRATVHFGPALASDPPLRALARMALPLLVGITPDGKPTWVDAAVFPHLLCGGETGGGKSEALKAMALCLAASVPPSRLALALVDPLRAEFASLEPLPHVHLVTNPREVVAMITEWVAEMDRRYRIFAQAGVKDIQGYHAKGGQMQYRLLVVDEYKQLKDALGDEADLLENGIGQLGQAARKTGLFVWIATQYPKAEVISTVLSGNLPAKLALRVDKPAKSLVIIGEPGAEALLGKGDALFLAANAGITAPLRIQAPFAGNPPDEAIEAVARHWAAVGEEGAWSSDRDPGGGRGGPPNPGDAGRSPDPSRPFGANEDWEV